MSPGGRNELRPPNTFQVTLRFIESNWRWVSLLFAGRRAPEAVGHKSRRGARLFSRNAPEANAGDNRERTSVECRGTLRGR